MAHLHQSRHPIVITIAGTLLIGAIAGLPFFVGPPNQEGLPDTAKFIGRFHPVVLHLPIGMIIWVIVSELLNVFSKRSDAPSSRTAMGFAAASAVIAALLGFVLYHSTPDYDRELVERHLYGGLAFSCASILAYVIKVWADTKGGKGTWLYRTVLLASVGIMTITSHDGASLTHGKGYLADYAPEPLRRSLGMEPRRTEKKIVDQDAEPAFEALPASGRRWLDDVEQPEGEERDRTGRDDPGVVAEMPRQPHECERLTGDLVGHHRTGILPAKSTLRVRAPDQARDAEGHPEGRERHVDRPRIRIGERQNQRERDGRKRPPRARRGPKQPEAHAGHHPGADATAIATRTHEDAPAPCAVVSAGIRSARWM